MADVKSPYPVAQRRRATPRLEWHDLARLQDLRDRHSQLLREHRAARDLLRLAKDAAAKLRRDLALASPTAAEVLTLPLEKLQRLSVAQMDEIHLDPRAIQRLAVAESRCKPMAERCAALSARLTAWNAFIENTEAYARRNHLDV